MSDIDAFHVLSIVRGWRLLKSKAVAVRIQVARHRKKRFALIFGGHQSRQVVGGWLTAGAAAVDPSRMMLVASLSVPSKEVTAEVALRLSRSRRMAGGTPRLWPEMN